MNFILDCQSIPAIFSINALLDAVKHEDFLEHIKDDDLAYKFEYEVLVPNTKTESYCITELQEEVGKILGLINPQTDQLFLQIIRVVGENNLKAGNQIFPKVLIWKNSMLPAALDIAYSLALYEVNFCTHFGDYLLSTDPTRDEIQTSCINSLINKYGIGKHTLYLLGSYALHDKGKENLIQLITTEHGDAIKNKQTFLLERLNQLNEMKRGMYSENVASIMHALQ